MEVRCAKSEDIELMGSAQELRSLKTSIEHFVQGVAKEIDIFTNSLADAKPYDICLLKICLQSYSKDNRIEVEGLSLIIKGSDEFLLNFSASLPFDADDRANGIAYHVHYDTIGFGDFLAQDSLGIIITKKRD